MHSAASPPPAAASPRLARGSLHVSSWPAGDPAHRPSAEPQTLNRLRRLYQLTWQNPVLWRYPGRQLSAGYATPVALSEGWGLTTDGAQLIASDGSAQLSFLDPDSLDVVATVQVRAGGSTWVGSRALLHLTRCCCSVGARAGH